MLTDLNQRAKAIVERATGESQAPEQDQNRRGRAARAGGRADLPGLNLTAAERN